MDEGRKQEVGLNRLQSTTVELAMSPLGVMTDPSIEQLNFYLSIEA